jgi:ketosteroid isomerase-like protein
MLMQELQVLFGVVVLAVITAGQAGRSEPIEIRLHSGTPLEERGRDQLHRLLQTHDVRKWLFTREILIQSRVIPHSHPVLTLNTRYVDDDTAQLATFVHEQIHWFLTDHVGHARTNAAVSELRGLYPQAPTAPPEGARDEWSTYLHLIVCSLELQALTELIGEHGARKQLERWEHYTWVYRTVLTDTEKIAGLVRRHGVIVPERESGAEQEILKLEKEWYDAFLRTDVDTMDRIEADDFIIITATTEVPVTKERQLANIRARSESARKRMDSMTRGLGQVKIRTYGNVAIVNGVQTQTSPDGTEGTRSRKSSYTGVWVERDGRWRIVNAQWTDFPEQKPQSGN